MELSTNLSQITKLYDYLGNQEKYKSNFNEEMSIWYPLLNYPDVFFSKMRLLNDAYKNTYSNKLIPILGCDNKEEFVCLYNDKYIVIHFASIGWENKGEYTTPEEVWEKKIKPDLDEYFG